MTVDADDVVDQFSKALAGGTAALFVGAGLSKGSGFVDWKGILREPAKWLGLDIDSEHDLPQIAGYYVQQRGNRGGLTQHLVTALDLPRDGTANHRIIARLPVKEIWTTNFDTLLEDTCRQMGRRCDVKRRDGDLMITTPQHDLRIYKMHGDIHNPEDVVITRSDYDQYEAKSPFMVSRFLNAIAESTLLFLGFGLEDPNFKHILAKHSARFRKGFREHFAVLLDHGGSERDRRRLALFVRNLQESYNIQAVCVAHPSEVTAILENILARAERPPKVLLGQEERNHFILQRLESALHDPDRSGLEVCMSMIFSSFAISDDPAYRAGEPISSSEHMTAIVRERDLLSELLRDSSSRFRLLLSPPNYTPENHVRYVNLLRWLEANADTKNLEVRCTRFDFTNMLIMRRRFCIAANYNPTRGYHENRVYEDDGNIEHFVRHFESLFERANIARDKSESIQFYREVLKRNTYRHDKQWLTLDTRVLHAWRSLALVNASVEVPDQGPREYVYVRHPGSVIVIPLLDTGQVLLANQYRYLIKRQSLEFPAGQIELGERPEQAAAREVEEETGYRAGAIAPLGSFFTSNALTDEHMTVFLATDLARVTNPLRGEDSIDIERKIVLVAELVELIRRGEINDGPTIASLHFLFEHLKR